MIEFSPLITAIVLFVAFVGWGKVFCKFFEKRIGEKLNPYLYPVTGMSVILVIGGYLNLLQIVNKVTIMSVLCVGIIMNSLLITNSHARKMKFILTKRSISFEGCVTVSAYTGTLVVFTLSSLNKRYNDHDDLEGYFSFASKILQQGTLGNDPFSERRLVSSLGGQSFLDAITLQFNSFDYLHVTDSGLGLCILLSSIFHYMKLKTWKKSAIACVIFMASMINPLTANITASYTLTAVSFVLITLILDCPISKKTNLNIVLFMIIAAGGLTLKNTALPFISLLTVTYFVKLSFLTAKAKSSLFMMFKSTLLLALSIWPWCTALYLSNGTLFYPLLGKGFHGSQYGKFNYHIDVFSGEFVKSITSSIIDSMSVTPAFTLLLFTLAVFFNSEKSIELKKAIFFIGICLLVSYFSIAIGTAGYDPFRYTFPFLFAYGVSIVTSLRPVSFVKIVPFFAFSVLISLGLMSFQNSINYEIFRKVNPRFALHSNFYPSVETISSIQNKLPVGQKALLRSRYNFLFNFKRNDLFIVDYPGGSSLPPGIPLFSPPERLKEYLIDQNIYYVIFQYSGLFEKEDFKHRLEPNYSPWLKAEAENTFAFQEKVMELSRSNPVLYRDEMFLVVKLTN